MEKDSPSAAFVGSIPVLLVDPAHHPGTVAAARTAMYGFGGGAGAGKQRAALPERSSWLLSRRYHLPDVLFRSCRRGLSGR